MSKLCDRCEDPSWTGQDPIVAPELPTDGGGVKIVDELPEKGQKGMAYVLVDDLENPTTSEGIFVYDEGWILTAQPVSEAVQKVDELPDEGEPGVLYYVPKSGDDTYDLYRWVDDSWIKVDTDVKLYSTTGENTDGAMTQKAVTDTLFTYYRSGQSVSTSGIRLTSAEDGNHNYKESDPSGCFVGGTTNADSVSISDRNTYATIIGNGQVGNGCIAIGAGTKFRSGDGGPSSTYVTDSIFIGASSGGRGESSSSKASYVIGIGKNARANRSGSIALGAHSTASAVGEMNIGSSQTAYGYNSSNYRLLTGLYDPQSAHDAATKGYVDAHAVKTLTSADYNWDSQTQSPSSANPDCLAFWCLDTGYYEVPEAIDVAMHEWSSSPEQFEGLVYVSRSSDDAWVTVVICQPNNGGVLMSGMWNQYNPGLYSGNGWSNITTDGMVASQINSYIDQTTTVPTNATYGADGQELVYYDTSTNTAKLFICTGSEQDPGTGDYTYHWQEIATKDYVDGLVGNIANALNVINNGGGN